MKIFLLVILFTIIAPKLIAQVHTNDLGFRFGFIPGVTYRHHQTMDKAIEGIFSVEGDRVYITGLLERFYKIDMKEEGFFWFAGAGAHAGLRAEDNHDDDGFFSRDDRRYRDDDRETHALVGLDGIIGLEYKIRRIPMGLTLDWKPSLDLIDDFQVRGADLALSLRYLF